MNVIWPYRMMVVALPTHWTEPPNGAFVEDEGTLENLGANVPSSMDASNVGLTSRESSSDFLVISATGVSKEKGKRASSLGWQPQGGMMTH